MKYAKILETLTAQPLLIMPGARDALLQLFEQHAALSREDFQAAREGKNMCGEAFEMEGMVIDEQGIAHIPISGPLGVNLGGFEKSAGAVDFMDIQRELADAEADDKVQAAILHFDSPGGTVTGTPETAAKIANFDKPIFAWANSATIGSAAYWLASSTDEIWASPSSMIGSIGVYTAYHDLSELAAQRGIKVKMFSSGPYKGMGQPGTSLTKDQERYLQDMVMQLAGNFYDHVRIMRPNVPDEAMQGQVFRAAEALNAGLIDRVEDAPPTLAELLG